jgi:hypothetical protein
MKVPTYATLPLSVFIGAASGALMADPTSALLSRQTAVPALVGALVAGLAAVVHLYQPTPVATPPAPKVGP